MSRRPRHLSAEERDLWNLIAKRTTPLDPDRPKKEPPAKPVPPKRSKPPLRDPIPHFGIGAKVDQSVKHNLAPSLTEQLRQTPVQMDSKSFARLKRGKLKPEGRIDLHGMTIEQAHPALVSFILSAYADQKRLVLVITGKGKDRDDGGPIPTRLGVLRHQVPQWLRLPPLNHAILQVSEAHLRHGGQGAYYVYLRRHR